MITKSKALTADTFHFGPCTAAYIDEWHRAGDTVTRSGGHWVIPVRKQQLTTGVQGVIDDTNAWLAHAAEDCPLKGR